MKAHSEMVVMRVCHLIQPEVGGTRPPITIIEGGTINSSPEFITLIIPRKMTLSLPTKNTDSETLRGAWPGDAAFRKTDYLRKWCLVSKTSFTITTMTGTIPAISRTKVTNMTKQKSYRREVKRSRRFRLLSAPRRKINITKEAIGIFQFT